MSISFLALEWILRRCPYRDTPGGGGAFSACVGSRHCSKLSRRYCCGSPTGTTKRNHILPLFPFEHRLLYTFLHLLCRRFLLYLLQTCSAVDNMSSVLASILARIPRIVALFILKLRSSRVLFRPNSSASRVRSTIVHRQSAL